MWVLEPGLTHAAVIKTSRRDASTVCLIRADIWGIISQAVNGARYFRNVRKQSRWLLGMLTLILDLRTYD